MPAELTCAGALWPGSHKIAMGCIRVPNCLVRHAKPTSVDRAVARDQGKGAIESAAQG
jgi:hypothetical protein